MAQYTPTNWQDRISSNPGQFSATGAVNGNIILTLNDNPTQAGTQVNAAKMNHIEQAILNIWNAWLAQSDVGALSLCAPQTTPIAPTVVSGTSGNLNGAYDWKVVLITGFQNPDGSYWVNGFAPSSANGTFTLTNQQANLSSIATVSTGTIGRAIYRTKAGGAAGTEQFAGIIWNNSATTWTDNVADNTLGTGMPTSSSSPAVYGVTSVGTLFSDSLTSSAAWTVQTGSFTYSSSGATSGASGSVIAEVNSSWKPLTGSGGQNLPLTVQATFTTPSTVPVEMEIDLYTDLNDRYRLTWQSDNNLVLYKYVGGISTALVNDNKATTQVVSRSYTMTLSIDNSGHLTAKLYSGSGTGGTLLQTLTVIDTSLSGGFSIAVGGDTGVIISNASVTGPVAIPSTVPITNTTGTPVNFGAPVTFDSPVYLNGVNNVNAPPTPVILASSNIQGVGMTEYGDLVPINPSQIQNSTYWTVKDKNGNAMWKVYLAGGAIDVNAYLRLYNGLYVTTGPCYINPGIAWNYSWSGTINTGTSTTLTHNLGHYPIVALAGTTGNLELTYRFQDLETIVISNYSSGGNNWTGGVYLL